MSRDHVRLSCMQAVSGLVRFAAQCNRRDMIQGRLCHIASDKSVRLPEFLFRKHKRNQVKLKECSSKYTAAKRQAIEMLQAEKAKAKAAAQDQQHSVQIQAASFGLHRSGPILTGSAANAGLSIMHLQPQPHITVMPHVVLLTSAGPMPVRLLSIPAGSAIPIVNSTVGSTIATVLPAVQEQSEDEQLRQLMLEFERHVGASPKETTDEDNHVSLCMIVAFVSVCIVRSWTCNIGFSSL